ncbi:MAG: FAD-dependent oxidoreductase [Candidatus Omnitrophica bacterium]|nr:FAD-dependent oxidoreductase [Candidatus Omnitrophota bacterium]
MSKVVIVGGGFAGISFLTNLCRFGKGFEITLIDKKESFDFLPLLPDLIGRGIKPEYLKADLKSLCAKLKADFINQEVKTIDAPNREIVTEKGRLSYDYLVVSCGSQTNFYGNSQIESIAYKLDSVGDTLRLMSSLREKQFSQCIIAGGGYTGIEIATNLRSYFKKNMTGKKITIIEQSSGILGPLPGWIKDYTIENLKRLEIDIITGSSIEKVENRDITLSDKRQLKDCMLIWCAGVKVPDIVDNLKGQRGRQNRVVVDEYLRLSENCFVIGDASCFNHKNVPLRMAIQFSLVQGRIAAKNIISTQKNKRLIKYRPRDLGYIVPMVNNRSCGIVLGIKVKGFLATFLHFFMCIYRSLTFYNKFGLIKDLIRGGNKHEDTK